MSRKITKYKKVKELKTTLTADKFELIESCIVNKEGNSIGKMLTWNNIADSLKKGVSVDSIAKAICKQVK